MTLTNLKEICEMLWYTFLIILLVSLIVAIILQLIENVYNKITRKKE